MKKTISILTLLILIPTLCFAGTLQEKQMAVIAKKNVSAPTSCSGACHETFTDTAATAINTHDAKWLTNGTGTITDLVIDGTGAMLRSRVDYGVRGTYYDDSTSDTSQILLKANPDSAFQTHVCVRMTGSTYGYCLSAISNGTNYTFSIDKDTSSLCTIAATAADSSDRTIKIVVSGTSTVTVQAYVDGTLQTSDPGSCTDSSTPLAVGHPGFVFFPGVDSTLSFVDNWQDH